MGCKGCSWSWLRTWLPHGQSSESESRPRSKPMVLGEQVWERACCGWNLRQLGHLDLLRLLLLAIQEEEGNREEKGGGEGKGKRKTEEREDSGRDHDEGRTVSSDTLSQWRDHAQGRKVSSTYTTSTYA